LSHVKKRKSKRKAKRKKRKEINKRYSYDIR